MDPIRRMIALSPAALFATPALARGEVHAFSFRAIDGAPLPLARFRGRVLMIVNTASRCGFTDQYADLQRLHLSHGERGLTIIGVPSNDFGGQEPGSNAEIRAFCSDTFGVTFPLTERVSVRGPDAHPFYAFAAGRLGAQHVPRWNFHKYLVAADGTLMTSFPSATRPSDRRVMSAIDREISLIRG